MKNEKLSLKDLKVKSFVTNFKNDAEATVKGGNTGGTTCHIQSALICDEAAPTADCGVETFKSFCGDCKSRSAC